MVEMKGEVHVEMEAETNSAITSPGVPRGASSHQKIGEEVKE